LSWQVQGLHSIDDLFHSVVGWIKQQDFPSIRTEAKNSKVVWGLDGREIMGIDYVSVWIRGLSGVVHRGLEIWSDQSCTLERMTQRGVLFSTMVDQKIFFEWTNVWEHG